MGNDADEGEDNMSDTSDIPVYKELVDDKFTVENIGEVSTQVRRSWCTLSHVSAFASGKLILRPSAVEGLRHVRVLTSPL